MTKSEYQELVEFIAPRFDAIDNRFDAIDNRFDAIDERLRRVEILGEENRHQIQIVAEGVTGVDDKLEAFRSEVDDKLEAFRSEVDGKLEAFRSEVAAGFQNVHELLRGSNLELDRRVTRLEEGLSS